MQDGREENKHANKKEHKDRVKLKQNKNKQKLLSGAKKTSEVVVMGFPAGLWGGIPHGKVIDFPLG